MSNPIADDADYFSSKHPRFHRAGAPNQLNIQDNDTSKPTNLLSPASPVTRRQYTQAPGVDTAPRAKWQNLIQRLSTFQADQDDNDAAEEGTHRSLWDMPPQAYNSPANEDDTLPTPDQCYNEDAILEQETAGDDTEDKQNFFTSPFEEMEVVDVPEPPPAQIRKPRTEDSHVGTPSEGSQSARTKKSILSTLMRRKSVSESSDHDSMQMTPTLGTAHSNAPAAAGKQAVFEISPKNQRAAILKVMPNTPFSICYIPSDSNLVFSCSEQKLVPELSGERHLIRSSL